MEHVQFDNAWRQENPDIRPDLSGANLIEANLIGTDLSQANLSHAKLHRAILNSVNLSQARQVRAATDHAANAAGRLAGKELLKFVNDETTIGQLKDRIAKTIDYLKNIKQSEIDGTGSKEISITFPSGQTRQFTGQSLLLGK